MALPESKTVNPQNWIDEYGDFLFRYAISRVRNEAAAEDMVQETFLAAFKSRANFTGQSSERTWLVGILKHKMMDYFRKISRERTETDVNSADSTAASFFDERGMWKMDDAPSEWTMEPGAALEQKEFIKTLEDCMGKLPARLSHAFTLVEREELKGEEACKILNVTATNLYVILYRARMLLRKCLEMNWFHKG